MVQCFALVLLLLKLVHWSAQAGILYPRQSETRETLPLDGIWNFRATPKNSLLAGFDEKWYSDDLSAKSPEDEILLMPVPSSYNDLTENADLRDHLGVVWYDRRFFVPQRWINNTRVWLRFSSVSYAAEVWINGKLAMRHEIGHLPFQREITSFLNFTKSNRITVACDNMLLNDSVPQGTIDQIKIDDGIKNQQSYTFDFFNYAGIHRPVTLFTTPLDYIDDIDVHSNIENKNLATLFYNVSVVSKYPTIIFANLLDSQNNLVAKFKGAKGQLSVSRPRLWWPYLMDPSPGYLYTLEVQLLSADYKQLLDVYRLQVGIRTLKWTNTSLILNGKPLYLHGFGRHEDADLRGKGLDLVTVVKDYNLIKWVGGNAYRTSHYPYADEIMDFADRHGIMIIDECPSVNTNYFSKELLRNHKTSLTELIKRDKNRPSVIAWSIANEPRTKSNESGLYFGKIAKHVRLLDRTRPITLSSNTPPELDKAAEHLDIISFNTYNSWYHNPGDLDTITNNVIEELTEWHKKFNKPVIISEYGAGTIAGLHFEPPIMWSEEYQVEMLSRHFKAFDYLRKQKWFIGEFIWNFADFNTAQGFTRVAGNKKGIFTRQRQPKAAAHHLRLRYLRLANELHNATLPEDLHPYIIASKHTEL